ncbi:4284_t:CDS:2, partial [Dentiscutata heterogama]
ASSSYDLSQKCYIDELDEKDDKKTEKIRDNETIEGKFNYVQLSNEENDDLCRRSEPLSHNALSGCSWLQFRAGELLSKGVPGYDIML